LLPLWAHTNAAEASTLNNIEALMY